MTLLVSINVITFDHAIAAPFSTRQLTDLGVCVIKVKPFRVRDFAHVSDEHAMATRAARFKIGMRPIYSMLPLNQTLMTTSYNGDI
ncbi:hypothetical protein BTK96_002963 [Burkholderia pyrrocinia]|uniref:hypothetical protein n=1 Tax=Burkholderia TaxID=32008 RepID=UPI00158C2159|nr:hypothetical protein [Burkholderia pyrrocinia]EKS9892368.1 hypothetical protein [Burkholderia pyrrocinia]